MKTLVAAWLVIVVPLGLGAQTPPATSTAPGTATGTATANKTAAPATTPGAKAGPAAKTAPTGKTTTAAGTKAAGTSTAAKAAATTKGATAKGAAKKDEPPPKIEGMEIARSAGGFLGLQVVGGNFKLAFYDKDKKPVAPNVGRAVLRWTPNYKPGNEVYVLGAGDGKSLTAEKTVRPPYSFKLFMSLFVEGKEDPVESYVVDFRQ